MNGTGVAAGASAAWTDGKGTIVDVATCVPFETSSEAVVTEEGPGTIERRATEERAGDTYAIEESPLRGVLTVLGLASTLTVMLRFMVGMPLESLRVRWLWFGEATPVDTDMSGENVDQSESSDAEDSPSESASSGVGVCVRVEF